AARHVLAGGLVAQISRYEVVPLRAQVPRGRSRPRVVDAVARAADALLIGADFVGDRAAAGLCRDGGARENEGSNVRHAKHLHPGNDCLASADPASAPARSAILRGHDLPAAPVRTTVFTPTTAQTVIHSPSVSGGEIS